MRSTAVTTWCCLILVLAGGCASGSSAKEEVPPEQKALSASHRQIQRSVNDAYETSEDLDPYTLPVRYNRPRCDAPAFEVRAHGRWTRAYLRTDDEIQQKLDALQSGDEAMVGAGEAIKLRGTWRGAREAETGLEYPIFAVEAIVN